VIAWGRAICNLQLLVHLLGVASTAQAYAVQDAMIAAGRDLGLGKVWGWKTGTAPLFTCGKWADGAVLSVPALKISAIEGEVGLIVSATSSAVQHGIAACPHYTPSRWACANC
jgi:hypothetical protein